MIDIYVVVSDTNHFAYDTNPILLTLGNKVLSAFFTH
jgi:hypothetical protein